MRSQRDEWTYKKGIDGDDGDDDDKEKQMRRYTK